MSTSVQHVARKANLVDACKGRFWEGRFKSQALLDEYLELVEWSGRMLREDKRGKIPQHLDPILQRLQIDRDNWLNTVEQYGGWFCHAVGRVDSIMKAAKDYGRKWLKGLTTSQVAFTPQRELKT